MVWERFEKLVGERIVKWFGEMIWGMVSGIVQEKGQGMFWGKV